MIQAALPARTNPLAKRIGQRLALVRTSRGLSVARAAEELGISGGHYMYLEQGKVLPAPNMASRLYQWAVAGISFEGQGRPKEGTGNVLQQRKWRVIKTAVSRDTAVRLRKEAARLGMSGSSLAHIYITQGLQRKAAFATLQKAIVEVRKAEALQLFTECPQIKDFLLADPEICRTAGLTLTHVAELQPLQPTIEKLAELPKAELRLTMEEEVEEI